jgi:hypothetical protein
MMKPVFKNAGSCLVLFLLITGGRLLANEPWKEVDTQSGITIYERWVRISDELTVRERKGEMTINCTMSSVINILSDPSRTSLWMENVTDAYLVSRRSNIEWAYYTYFSMPWPLENRDMVSLAKLNYSDPSSATIEMISLENALPVKDNVVRLMDFKATWKITDLGNGSVFVSLSAISYRSPEFPRFIMDPVVRGVFMRNLIKLKVLVCI